MKNTTIQLFIILTFFSGCSHNEIKEKKSIAVKNNNIKLVNQTVLHIKGPEETIINEFCIDGTLIIFIDSYRSGGAVSMGKKDKCLNKKQ